MKVLLSSLQTLSFSTTASTSYSSSNDVNKSSVSTRRRAIVFGSNVVLSPLLNFCTIRSFSAIAQQQQDELQQMEPKVENSDILVGRSGGSDTDSSDCISGVRKLLFCRMLAGIKDGRFFLGTFHCIDKQGNIILQDVVEYRSSRHSSPSLMEQRCLALILIPSSRRTSCHKDCSVEEQLSLLKVDQ